MVRSAISGKNRARVSMDRSHVPVPAVQQCQ